MYSLIKPKRFVLLLIGFLLLPVIIPIISDTLDVIFNYGVEVGTYLRRLLEGFSC